MKYLMCGLLAGVVLLFGVGPAAAATDPALQWHTIDTPHFSVHYPHTLAELGEQAAPVAEEAWQVLTKLLDWVPDDHIHLIISDFGDSPNGLASVLPYDRIKAYAAAPDPGSTLGYFNDWLRLLIYHELTHIIHINSVGGLPRTFNRFFGKTLLPNATLPKWFVEGLATYHESLHTGYGRLYSPTTDMMIRMAILDDRLPDLDKLSATPDQWPRGHAHYLYGARFIGYLHQRFGDEAMARFIAEYGQQVIPYGLNKMSRRVFGYDVITLWQDWKSAEKARVDGFRFDLAEEGITPLRRLTKTDGVSLGPRFAPGGDQVVWYEETSDREPRLVLARRQEGEGSPGGEPGLGVGWGDLRISTLFNLPAGGGSPAFSPDGQSVYFWAPTWHKTFYKYGDIYRLDLDPGPAGGGSRGGPVKTRGAPVKLTRGERARELDVSPVDGWLVWVANVPGGSVLRVAPPTMDPIIELEVPGVRQFDGPRWSPVHRGRLVVSGLFEDRMRDLVTLDLSLPPGGGEGQALVGSGLAKLAVPAEGITRLTRSPAMELTPSWSSDGDRILFTSSRDGVYNLYQVDCASSPSQVERLTRLVGGALHGQFVPGELSEAAPAGTESQSILASGYFSDGYDLILINQGAGSRETLPGHQGAQHQPRPTSGIEGQIGTGTGHARGSEHRLRESLFQIVPSPLARQMGEGQDELSSNEGTLEHIGSRSLAMSPLGAAALTSTPYSPLRTIAPSSWTPLLDINPFGPSGGLMLQGEDAASRHYWSGIVDGGLSYPVIFQGAARYTYGGLGLDLAVSGGRSVHNRGNVLHVGGRRYPYLEDSINLGFEVGRPFNLGMRSRHYLNMRVDGQKYAPFFKELPAQDPFARKPSYPPAGYGYSVSSSWSYSDVISFASSISPERGKSFALSARYYHPLVKNHFHGFDFGWRAKGYVPVPLGGLTGHVLMGSLLGGVSVGHKEAGLRRYFVGGPPSMDLVQSIVDGTFLGGGYLRGFPYAYLYGTSYHVATGEYRFPLITLDQAPGTLPVQLGKIHGALFADGGTANSPEEGMFHMEHLSVGAGAELRTTITLAYSFSFLIRAGVAKGFGPDGVWDWYMFFGQLP